jgi:uncharacterized membrane protein YbjE (DUF340 family)
MIEVLIIMTAGIIVGLLLRKKQNIINYFNKSIIWFVIILLFLMGISVGINNKIMDNLSSIGLQGFILALVAVFGSSVLSYFVYTLFFKKK